MKLRPYQQDLKQRIYQSWQSGARNVLAVLPTGGGKTCTFSSIIADNKGASVAIAHRSELVSQMSMALARNGIRHRVIGTPALSRTCSALHVAELKRSYTDPNARCAVASVDTLVRRNASDSWFKEVNLWITDEVAHLLRENKWGDAVAMFPNARGLGMTATPCRADGKGLGRHADGVMDDIIVGPTMRHLINDGWLTDYRIFAPPSDLDLNGVGLSANGDFSPEPLRKAVHRSHIVGDVVQHYLRIAPGKLGITFCVDVEAATETAAAFRAAGVPAEVVSAKTPDLLRAHILRRFKNREISQLVNVDLFGEGFDLPAIEVVSFARPTQSFGLYAQQFGRGVRLMDGKTRAYIIDHVGNVLRHRLPDAPRVWTLDRKDRRARSSPDDVIPLRICGKCLAAYERVLLACPYCGEAPVPATRSAPEAVDGDLHEMSAELLAKLRSEAAAIDQAPKIPYGAKPEVVGAIKKRHRERQEAQSELRRFMALWGGWQEAQGRSVRESQRRFFHGFGVDVATAQGLGRAEASELCGRIRGVLDREGVKGIDEVVSNE